MVMKKKRKNDEMVKLLIFIILLLKNAMLTAYSSERGAFSVINQNYFLDESSKKVRFIKRMVNQYQEIEEDTLIKEKMPLIQQQKLPRELMYTCGEQIVENTYQYIELYHKYLVSNFIKNGQLKEEVANSIPHPIRHYKLWFEDGVNCKLSSSLRSPSLSDIDVLYQGATNGGKEEFEKLVLLAERGDHLAEAYISILYLGVANNLIKRDIQKADDYGRRSLIWIQEEANNGNSYAQNILGDMHLNGNGVPCDNREAVKWFRRAAEQGNAEAQYNLAGMYESGIGVRKNDFEAYKWLKSAAEKGHKEASAALKVVSHLLKPNK